MKITAVEKLFNIWLNREYITEDEWLEAIEMEKEQMIAFGKRCFYKGFDKAENDDANCFTAWREEAEELLTKQQKQ
jgi:hypothetical protein